MKSDFMRFNPESSRGGNSLAHQGTYRNKGRCLSQRCDVTRYTPCCLCTPPLRHCCTCSLTACVPPYRQISVISADGDNTRCRSVRRHGCSQKKQMDGQEKKKRPEAEKLIQAETAETGRVKAASFFYVARFILGAQILPL